MKPEFHEPESDELLLISEMQREEEDKNVKISKEELRWISEGMKQQESGIQVWEEDEDPEGFWGK